MDSLVVSIATTRGAHAAATSRGSRTQTPAPAAYVDPRIRVRSHIQIGVGTFGRQSIRRRVDRRNIIRMGDSLCWGRHRCVFRRRGLRKYWLRPSSHRRASSASYPPPPTRPPCSAPSRPGSSPTRSSPPTLPPTTPPPAHL